MLRSLTNWFDFGVRTGLVGATCNPENESVTGSASLNDYLQESVRICTMSDARTADDQAKLVVWHIFQLSVAGDGCSVEQNLLARTEVRSAVDRHGGLAVAELVDVGDEVSVRKRVRDDDFTSNTDAQQCHSLCDEGEEVEAPELRRAGMCSLFLAQSKALDCVWNVILEHLVLLVGHHVEERQAQAVGGGEDGDVAVL